MADGMTGRNIDRLVHTYSSTLAEAGIENPRLDVELLMAHVLRCKRGELYLQPTRPLNAKEAATLAEFIGRRRAREPLQYILGETEFYSLPFKVGPAVLIPRPETELLVEHARRLGRDADEILDIGTGSGCIPIALARELALPHFTAIDISAAALSVAQENAERLGVAARIMFIQGDILEPQILQKIKNNFGLILSNPPYISSRELAGLQPEVRDFEPHEALIADNPLRFYEHICTVAKERLASGGHLLVEIAPHWAAEVQACFQRFGLVHVQVHRDLAGRNRLVLGQKS